MAPEGYSGGGVPGGLLSIYGNLYARGLEMEPLYRFSMLGTRRLLYFPQIAQTQTNTF